MKIIVVAMLFLGFQTQAKTQVEAPKFFEISVTEKGFEPNGLTVKPGTTVTLQVTRKTDSTCATEIQVPSKKIIKELPLNQMVTIELGRLEKGEINFGCGMSMMEGGVISVK